jgi:hypothetical protein
VSALPLGTVGVASPTATPLAIPPLTGRLMPGTGYCIVLTVSGGAKVLVGRWVNNGKAGESIVRHVVRDATWSTEPFIVPMGLFGDAALTTTIATEVVDSVSMTLTGRDGMAHAGSACVSNQSLVEEPWLGVVATEVGRGP